MAFEAATVVGLFFLLLETVVGVMSSIFIVIVISLEFIKHHRVISSNKLIIPLCFSAVFFSVMLATNTIIGVFLPEQRHLAYVICFYVMNMYSISSCSWLTSCLCFFYFVKIANVWSGCLAWTKRKIDSIVLWMLVVVEAVSLCGPLLNSLILVLSPNHTMNRSSVITDMTESKVRQSTSLNIMYITNIVPFVVMMITVLLTIVSLNLHIRKMGKNISSNGSLEVHRRAVRTMMQLLILYSAFYLIQFLSFFSTLITTGQRFWLPLTLLSLFSPIQSAILIHSNPKFMKTWKTLYKSVFCIKCQSE